MIEQIIDGILGDVWSNTDAIIVDEELVKRRWRIIIRKAISENRKKKAIPFAMGYEGGRRIAHKIASCSQAMLEETAVGRRS